MTNRTIRTMIACTAGACVSGFAAAQSVADADITIQINQEHRMADAVDANRVDVSTSNGHVTLSGTVNNLLEKRRAADIALATVGVRSVTNNIDVRESTRSEQEIRNDVQRALLADPAADSYEITAKVDDGTVTLTGTVESYAEQQHSERVAAGVRGVQHVDNNIDIDYAAERPDREIKADVKQRLAHTVIIDDRLLDVAVDDGEVTLRGSVGSAAEKDNAYSLAWVAGVDSVDTSSVTVEWWARDDMRRYDLYASITDESIEDAIEDAYVYSPLLDASEVTTTVDDGNVVLTGEVDDLRAKNAAENLAEMTVGVWDVDNFIRIDSPDAVRDSSLESDLQLALLRDPYVDRFDITVEVVNGHAHLYGEVDTEYEKTRAELEAESIDGVVDVRNYLSVGDTWEAEEDWKIAEEIRDELFWSPFVDSDEVSVTVMDGVATLEGTVDTLDERAAAVENALEGGARIVDNDLAVDYGPEPLLP